MFLVQLFLILIKITKIFLLCHPNMKSRARNAAFDRALHQKMEPSNVISLLSLSGPF